MCVCVCVCVCGVYYCMYGKYIFLKSLVVKHLRGNGNLVQYWQEEKAAEEDPTRQYLALGGRVGHGCSSWTALLLEPRGGGGGGGEVITLAVESSPPGIPAPDCGGWQTERAAAPGHTGDRTHTV